MSRIYFYLNIFEEIKAKVAKEPGFFKNKENQVPIYVDYSFGSRLRISTKIFVNPNDWDPSKQKVKSTDIDAKAKNYRLVTIRGKLINIETEAIRDDIKLTVPYIKLKLSPSLIVKGDSSNVKFFSDTWNEFVKLPDKNEGTRYNYQNTLRVLQDFCLKKERKLTLDEITADFYDDLINYFFQDRKMVRNTAGKYIKNIKAFMNYCTSKGFNNNLDFKQFEIFSDQKLITYLTIEELKKLKDLTPLTEIQEETRDLFLFMCFSGCRYCDTQKITEGNIRHGFIQFTTIKTKRPQGTPLTRQALEVLKKYNYSLPKISIKVFNDNLKKIGSAAGFTQETIKIKYIGSTRIEVKGRMFEFFSSHLAKRTFISIYFRRGGSLDTIMKTTGNTDRKTMKHYLEIENQDIKNESDRIFDNLDI